MIRSQNRSASVKTDEKVPNSRMLHIVFKKAFWEEGHWHIKLYWMRDMGVVDNASDENNENTRRKATVVPIKIEYV